ncbi:FAD-binding protein [Lichenicoccus sp.]|uniref:FAD-binding protein n=1 Tax=Lichenicoccus sp. TaxID=2781899 RepID=UPI003D0A41AC
MTRYRPADAAEAAEIVAWAAAEAQPLEIVGGGSKRSLGRAMRVEDMLDVAALSGILDYEPSELVLTVQAATPMHVIAARLDAERQMLAFEPPDFRHLLGSTGEPTLGGVLATNLAGPRRVRAGAARDHFLGFAAVNGRGETWKAGGKVVKNVTGYDLCKLQAGAHGTLSVLTELSVRVLPRPEQECSVLLVGLSDDAAIPALADALNTPHEVSSAAHLPALVAARSGVAEVAGAGDSVTVLRLEGPAPSVAFRADALRAGRGSLRLGHESSTALWAEIGAVQPLLADHDSLVWRVCPTPSSAPAVLRAVRAACPSADAFYDWGGGLLWISLDAHEAGADCGASLVRGTLAHAGGFATLLRAPEAARAMVPVFQPQAGALEALARRVKAGFDPVGVLNPGRMQEGI